MATPMTSRHPIQQAILECLRVASAGLRYTDMKPDDVESDLYNYHLQYLVKNQLVFKEDEKYFLTSSGKKYIIELNPLDEKGESNRFKIAVLCLVIRESEQGPQILSQHRLRQPFAGQREFIGGGLRRGEPVLRAAKRRLGEEAGLSANFTLLGMLRKVRFDSQGLLYSDIIYHVCVADKYEGDLAVKNEFGLHTWLPLPEAARAEALETNGSKQFSQVLVQLAGQPFRDLPLFYIEEIYHHDIF
ncbi:MAG: hypothetical protein JWN01_474 [Patescibacteria group bacterium]|nr:hypothetical protein [Patescibacteria group bacterium]